MTHWAAKYLGEAWTPVDNNCWAFARRVWAEQFRLSVPEIDVDTTNTLHCVRAFCNDSENDNWRTVQTPEQGDAVIMGKNKKPAHIGVWTGEGILHCMQGPGVIHNKVSALWITGLKVLSYHRRLV